MPPRDRAGSGIRDLAYNSKKQKRVWTVVGKGSGLTTIKPTSLSKNPANNVIVVDMKRRRVKIIQIVNIYNQCTREAGERPPRRLN